MQGPMRKCKKNINKQKVSNDFWACFSKVTEYEA